MVALHCNAAPESHTGKWSGTMVLHWPISRNGAWLAGLLSAAVAESIGIKDRGPHWQARSWNGPVISIPQLKGDTVLKPGGPILWVLKNTKAPAVILESHYMDRKSDHAKANKVLTSGKLPIAIVSSILAFHQG